MRPAMINLSTFLPLLLNGPKVHYINFYPDHEYNGELVERESLTLTLDWVKITFTHSQDCCEKRYMVVNGSTGKMQKHWQYGKQPSLVSLTMDRLPTMDENGEVHESSIMRILLSNGEEVDVTFHDEHNGYYELGCVSVKLETSFPIPKE
jgi:hypothetical protein